MNKRIPIILGFLLVIFSVWLQITTVEFFHLWIVRLDNLAYDMQLRTKIFTQHAAPTSPVAIVDIDDRSLQAEGRWPWSRSKLATLLDRLHEAGVAVIAMDIMFSEKEANIVDTMQEELRKHNLTTPAISDTLQKVYAPLDNDALFAKSLANKDVILGLSFLPRNQKSGLLPTPVLSLNTPAEKELGFINAKGYIGNIPVLQTAAKNGGFLNVYADADGIIRRVPLLMRYQDNIYPSLAFEAVNLYLLSKISIVTAEYDETLQLEAAKIANHTIPVDAFGQMLVPFRGKSYTFPFYSATDVLNKKIPVSALAGKIIFVGTSATGLSDLRPTAVQNVFPGVEVQATIADGILTDNYSYRPAWTTGAEMLLTFVFGMILVVLFPYLGPRSLATLSVFIPSILIIANNILWDKTGLIIFILVPILLTIMLAIMNMIYGYLFETRRRERIKEMFGQYVPEKHIDEMLKATGTYGLHGEDREMTVLFADIRNFTTISEPMTAAELKELLSQFFTPMTEVIFNNHGTIDKYIGDLIMAFWGAPLKDKRHAQHAIHSAIEMQMTVDKLKPVFAERGWPDVNIGIGLNSGVMSVGDMGSKFRRNYTVLGDAVNLASRVEGLTKHYGVKIMTTEATQKDQKKFVFRQLDRVRVKGKKLGVAIYEVIGFQTILTEALKHELELSQQALDFYFNQQWDEANRLFSDLHSAYPHVKLYQLYIDRIAQFKQNPPPADWDGVYEHTSK